MKVVFKDINTGHRLSVDETVAYRTLLEMHGGNSIESTEDLRAVLAGEPITVMDVDIYTE